MGGAGYRKCAQLPGREKLKMKALVALYLWVVLLVSGSWEATLEEELFESFLANYSRSYGKDPETYSAKFKVFQVVAAVIVIKVHSYSCHCTTCTAKP